MVPYNGSGEPPRWPDSGNLTLTIKRGTVCSEGTVLQKYSSEVISLGQITYSKIPQRFNRSQFIRV